MELGEGGHKEEKKLNHITLGEGAPIHGYRI